MRAGRTEVSIEDRAVIRIIFVYLLILLHAQQHMLSSGANKQEMPRLKLVPKMNGLHGATQDLH